MPPPLNPPSPPSADICREVLSFFLSAFESLRAQMGSQFTEQCVQVFLDVFGRDNMARSMLDEGEWSGCCGGDGRRVWGVRE